MHRGGDRRQTDRPGKWEVFTHGGRNNTASTPSPGRAKVESLGAGEILLTSMDRDGTKNGFDLALTRAVSDAVRIPVIASGGVGTSSISPMACSEGRADAVLAASIFHFGQHTVREAKGVDARARHRGEAVSENTLAQRRQMGRARPGAGDRAGASTGDVLMFAWMNREALQPTAETSETIYWSRSRRKLWHKGEESGHVQKVLDIRIGATTTWCCSGSSRLAASPATPDATAASSRNISPTAVGRPSIRF